MRDEPPTAHPLDRLLVPPSPSLLVETGTSDAAVGDPGLVRCLVGSGPAEWLQNEGVSVLARTARTSLEGEPIASFAAMGSGTNVTVVRDRNGTVTIPFSLAEAYETLVHERWISSGAKPRALTPGQLALYYRIKPLVPRKLQIAARRVLVRVQGRPAFPEWPYDDSVAGLLRLYCRCLAHSTGSDNVEFRWFWPDRARAACLLTHDVEGEAGLRNSIAIADLEEARGFRSSFNLVARDYEIDWGVVSELKTRGFEIGVHGLVHDRSMFSSRDAFLQQQPALAEAVARFGAVGFRSPATHRVQEWLGELPVEYDCSVPFSDPYEPQPGGCCSPWPYFIGDVVELPYTLPQDHTLFTLLGEQTTELWEEQVRRLEHVGGLIQCLTHPDPGYLGDQRNRDLYVNFLEFLRSRESLWHALPKEVARWWRERSYSSATACPDGLFQFDTSTGRGHFAPA